MAELGRTKRKLKDSTLLVTGRDRLTKSQKRTVNVELEELYPTKLPTLQQPPICGRKENLQARNQLCQRCAKLDIDTLLTRQHKTYRGLPVATLSPVAEWKIALCPLCSLLYSTLTPKNLNFSEKQQLRSFSSNKISSSWWRSIDTNLLGLNNSPRCLVLQPEGLNGPIRTIEKKINNYEIVKHWISLCRNHHTALCSVGDAPSIPSLKFIDCDTGKLVPATNHQYVALSYVWGINSDISEDPDKLPETVPRTIEDAMIVTKRVGYRYLWVDRYCINQRRKEDVAEQVGKMDLIYQNAELTIVAAAGDDPSYGLPGVCDRERMSHHLTTCAKIEKNFLISLDPYHSLVNTKWVTRAWTYQEGLLSRRRLVFTEEQMYFECYGMYCCESINLPIEEMHKQDMQGFKSVFCADNHVGVFPKGVGSTHLDVFRRMLGIFNAFERSRLGIKQYSGIPILPQMPAKGKSIKVWTPAMGFLAGMFWELEERAERRPGFPSWSWTGWYGPVTWARRYWPLIAVDPEAQISIELIDGRVLEWEASQAFTPTANLDLQLSNFIRITTWTIRIQIRKRDREKNKDEYTAKVELEDGGYLYWRFKSISSIELFRGQVCTGIILGHSIGNIFTRPPGPAILVVCKTGRTLERVGLGWVNQGDYVRYSKDNVRDLDEDRDGEVLWQAPMHIKPFSLVMSQEEIRLG